MNLFAKSPSAVEEAVVDQRTAPRFQLLLRTGKLVTSAGEFLCILRDASASGIKTRLFHALPDSERFELELGNGERFTLEPVWERDGHAGFRFVGDPVDIRSMINESDLHPRRQIRLRIDPPLKVELHVGHAVRSGMAINLSQSGVAITLDRPLALRQPVRIVAPGIGEVQGRVRWRRGATHGIVLHEVFRLEQLAELVARLQLGTAR